MGWRRYQQQHHSFTEDVRRQGRSGGAYTRCSRPRRSPGSITYRGLCVTNANPNAYPDHLPSHVCFCTYSDASSNRHTCPYSYTCPHGGGSAHGHASANSDSRANSHTGTYRDACAESHSNSCANGNTYADPHSHTNTYPGAYCDTHSNADTYANSYSFMER